MVQRNLCTNERDRKAASQLALSFYARHSTGDNWFSYLGTSGRWPMGGNGRSEQAPVAVVQWARLGLVQQAPVAVGQWERLDVFNRLQWPLFNGRDWTLVNRLQWPLFNGRD